MLVGGRHSDQAAVGAADGARVGPTHSFTHDSASVKVRRQPGSLLVQTGFKKIAQRGSTGAVGRARQVSVDRKVKLTGLAQTFGQL